MSSNFGFSTTSEQVIAAYGGANLSVLITGATAGIGLHTCAALVASGARVTYTARSETSANAAREEILKIAREAWASLSEDTPHRTEKLDESKLDSVILDLSTMSNVKSGVERFQSKHPGALDILINNAGQVNEVKELNEDGLERTFAVNHMGHFLLTLLLLPQLLQSKHPRVVNVSSQSHRSPSTLDFNTLETGNNWWVVFNMVAYGQSKLCNVLFAKELHRRFADVGLKSFALHPGTFISTNISRGNAAGRLLMALWRPFTKNVSQGASTTLVCALDPNAESGRYYLDCAPYYSTPESRNADVADRLWNLSLKHAEPFLTEEVLKLAKKPRAVDLSD